AGIVEGELQDVLLGDLRREEGEHFLLLGDVVPGVRIEGGDRRGRADQADDVLAALRADLELLHRARRGREPAVVDDGGAAREGERCQGAKERERDGATHGPVLMVLRRGIATAPTTPRGKCLFRRSNPLAEFASAVYARTAGEARAEQLFE